MVCDGRVIKDPGTFRQLHNADPAAKNDSSRFFSRDHYQMQEGGDVQHFGYILANPELRSVLWMYELQLSTVIGRSSTIDIV